MSDQRRISLRQNRESLKRDSRGQFTKNCQSTIHTRRSISNTLIDLKSRKRILARHYEQLIKSGIISAETKYICRECVDLVIKNPDKYGSNEPHDFVTAERDQDEVSDETIDYAGIGKKLRELVAQDVTKLYKEKKIKTIAALTDVKSTQWLSERPMELIQLLSDLCKVDLNTAKDAKCNVVAKIVELIYYCLNSKLILPNHFKESLYAYSLTNCKTFCNFMGNRAPGGSYYSLSAWLNSQARDPIKFPKGLVKSIFDNNQKIGKTHFITGDNKVPTIVMTSHLHLTLDEESTIQNKSSLKPEFWMWADRNSCSMINDKLTRPSIEFRASRNLLIKECIRTLRKELGSENKDLIAKTIEHSHIANTEKICPNCACVADVSHRVCRNVINGVKCGNKLVSSFVAKEFEKVPASTIDPYAAFIDAETRKPKTTCTIGEPDFINPNSYQTIIQIIQNIGYRAGVRQYGGERQWMFIECDGLPYNIIRDIIENVWRCKQCHECFYKMETFNEHKCAILSNSSACREFCWVVPVLGLFHLELNATRAFLKRNWNVFVSVIGHSLGFQTPKAQSYLLKGSDHHKSWQLMEILYTSFSLELIHPYVSDALNANKDPTVEGYWEWNEQINDPNYIYIQHMTLTYLHALMMLRSGVRKCNYPLVEDARIKVTELFFGGNHPIYQKILVSDTIDSILMPEELRETREKYVSSSRTGHAGKFQGGDALLEEVNKESKTWLKLSGIPSEERWLRIFRNLEDLNKFKFEMTDSTGEDRNRQRKNEAQVHKVRILLRERKYLLDPFVSKEHLSIDGKKLNQQLVNFSQLAHENVLSYIDSMRKGDELKLNTIYTTQEEFEEAQKIENLTKKEITVKIYEIIDKLGTSNQKLQEERFKRDIKAKNKENYVSFYYEMYDLFLQQEDQEETLDDEEEE